MEPDKSKIIVCRCEEITLADIEQAIAQGARTLAAVKVRTNAGMGVCQGMTCRRNIERMLQGLEPEGSTPHSPYRFPVRTVSVNDLSADLDKEDCP